MRRLRYLISEHEDCGLVWFLGAGCSVSSGIPTAAGLVRQWLPRLKSRETQSDGAWEAWAQEEFPGCSTDAGGVYGAVMDRLFPLQNERQREIERLTAERDPGIGYALLSLLMCHDRLCPQTNVVLTTNFDDLVQDAFYLVTSRKPLVVVHDSLAPFVRYSRTRPLIVKVHGDAHLAPRNTPRETAELSKEMVNALATVLNNRALIFVGYGGNDRSVAGLLRSLPPTTFPWGVYWVGERFPSGPVAEALCHHQDLWWVPHHDFDGLMLEITEEFELGAPSFDRWMKLRDTYERTLERQRAGRRRSPDGPVATGVADRMTARLRGRSLLVQAFAMADEPDRADALYREAVEAAPDDPAILGGYARFLERSDPDTAQQFYLLALDADPANATNLGRYASFLHMVRQKHDRAEEYYRRAVDVDPIHAGNLRNYAVFLHTVRCDYDRAEDHYRRAIEADPTHPLNLGSYAVFLETIRQDYDRAEGYYSWALEADPSQIRLLPRLARALYMLGRHDEASSVAAQALEFDPEPDVRLELDFYQYAHVVAHRDQTLRRVRSSITAGHRGSGRNLTEAAARAAREGHPQPDLLADLARVIADEAPADVLERYEAWRAAGE